MVEDIEVFVRQLRKKKPVHRLCHRRVNKLGKIKKLFGDSVGLLPPEQALAELLQANTLVDDEALRPKDKNGAPGGVVMVPNKLIPIIIGDLHAQIDNLLQVFIENSFLEMLDKGRACLIILGDAVHSEEDGKLEEMEDQPC